MTLNYAEMIRECVHWTSKAPKAPARYLYWISDKRPRLSSAILINQARLSKLCQTPTNKIQHNTMASLRQQADIKDNYPLWTSQATILKNISKSYLEQNVTQDARSWKRPQCPQVKKANQLIKQQMQIYIYSRRKARGITCKLTSISRRHGLFILIQSIIYF